MKQLNDILQELYYQKTLSEIAPASKKIEKWILKMKPAFKKRYGNLWKKVLYASAWKRYNKKEAE